MTHKINRGLRLGVAIFLTAAGLRTIPSSWCGREAKVWYDGEKESQMKLADGVNRWLQNGLSLDDFNTGSELFDGEWLFGSYLMAGIGLCQMVIEHPELKQRYIDSIHTCLEGLQSEKVRAFDAKSWHSDPLLDLDGPKGHAAYLGYYNLLLSLHRSFEPESRFSELNDQITSALVRRIDTSPTGLLMTYPHEIYPVDNAAVIASIGLHNRVTQAGRASWLANYREQYTNVCIDRDSGLLIQAVDYTGSPIDKPRGSGTALAAYFLSFADVAWSATLYQAMTSELTGHLLGFGAVREYRKGVFGLGDIDSGPIVLGWSFSATGFGIASCRINEDPRLFKRLFASAWLAGAPLDRNGERSYVTGGPLGNCILLAMFTAQKGGLEIE